MAAVGAVMAVGTVMAVGSFHRMFPRIFVQRRQNYKKLLTKELKESLREALSQPQLPWGRIAEIQSQTQIPRPNLDRWRAQLLRGEDPWAPAKRRSHYSLPPHIEARIYDDLISRVDQNQFVPRPVFRTVAKNYGVIANPNFKAGRSWTKGFLKRFGLSFRLTHPRRRTAPNDAVVAAFLQELEVAKEQMEPSLIFNMDETAWRLFNGQLLTLTRRGVDEVNPCDARVDDKANFTVLCTITLDGQKLPPWVIVKGRTDRCEDSYRNDPRLRSVLGKKLFLTHSDSGWSTSEVMKQYLEWLAEEHTRGSWAYLVWDVHASHRHDEAKRAAAENAINLGYIPAGQTSTWQPLDVRVFGALKAHARSLLDAQCLQRPIAELDMVDALLILVQAWRDLKRETIITGWKSLVDLETWLGGDEEEDEEEEGDEE